MSILVVILIVGLCIWVGFKKPSWGFLLSIIVSSIFACVSVALDVPRAILFASFFFVITFVATLIAILLSKEDKDFQKWPKRVARWIILVLGALLLLTVLSFFLGPLGFLDGIVLVVCVIGYCLTERNAVAGYVFTTIGSSMRQNLPLTMALEAAAEGQGVKRTRVIRGIKKWLLKGYSLSESLKRGYPQCPGYAAAMVLCGERINQLPYAVWAVEKDIVRRAGEKRWLKPIDPRYPLVMTIFVFLFVLGLARFVIPIFREVLAEMVGDIPLSLPASTVALMKIAEFFSGDYGAVVSLIFLVLIILAVPVSIRIKFRPRRADRPYLFSKMGDFIRWHFPGMGWFERNYSMLKFVEFLGLSLKSGCTLNEAIANTLGLDINFCFKKRLSMWLKKVEAGENVSEAARDCKVGSTIEWAFDDKVNQGNTLAILEMLESFYRSNYGYYVNLARHITEPVVVIMLGLMVGFVVYGVFSPMVLIIIRMSESFVP